MNREYHALLELNDGTEIRYSDLLYSGVYFECRTPDEKLSGGYKRAVTCWPVCVEPLRFFEVDGYSATELNELRKYIYKVGNLVVDMLLERSAYFGLNAVDLNGRRPGEKEIQAYNVRCMMPYMDYVPRMLEEITGYEAEYNEDKEG